MRDSADPGGAGVGVCGGVHSSLIPPHWCLCVCLMMLRVRRRHALLPGECSPLAHGVCWKILGEMQRSEMRGRALSELAALEVALSLACAGMATLIAKSRHTCSLGLKDLGRLAAEVLSAASFPVAVGSEALETMEHCIWFYRVSWFALFHLRNNKG